MIFCQQIISSNLNSIVKHTFKQLIESVAHSTRFGASKVSKKRRKAVQRINIVLVHFIRTEAVFLDHDFIICNFYSKFKVTLQYAFVLC